MKKPRFKLIYQGRSLKEAQKATEDFWKDVSPEEKLNACTQAITEAMMLKGIDFYALRLLRTTAIIRKP